MISPKTTIQYKEDVHGSPYLYHNFKILDEDINDSDCYCDDSFPNMNSLSNFKKKTANKKKLTEFY